MNPNKTNLVSVIVPIFNAINFIDQAIQSILEQTYQNFEIILIDDFSRDGSADHITKKYGKNNKVKIILNKENLGAAKTRNIGINNATGSYLAFLDADDFWDKSKLELQLKFMAETKSPMTFTSYRILFKSNRTKVIKVPYKLNLKKYFLTTIIGNLTVMVDRTKIPNFYFPIGHLEDTLAWISILKEFKEINGLNKSLATYRIVENSISSNKFRNSIRYFKILNKQKNLNFFQKVYYLIISRINALIKRL